MAENTRMAKYKRNLVLVVVSSTLIAILGTLAVLFWAGWLNLPQANRQATVHGMGSQVMPFDLGQTTRTFSK